MRSDKFFTLITITVLMVLYKPEVPIEAKNLSPTEYQIKAAFLYNFAKFVEWPSKAFPDPSAPIILGILGKDPFGSDLDEMIKDKTVNNRSLALKRFKGTEELEVCHILFISSSERKHLARLFEILKGRSVLTVGETERFVQVGGVINFIMRENKVRFEINVAAAERANLKISSKLLKLAEIIGSGKRG